MFDSIGPADPAKVTLGNSKLLCDKTESEDCEVSRAVMNDAQRESTIGQRFRRTLAGLSISFGVVRFLLAGVLLVAATLKTLFPVTESMAPPFAIALILFELFLAVWLISGLLPRFSWCVATLCFAAFAAISVMKIAAGETDCGCFGVLRVSPWFALSIDMAAVLLLLSSYLGVRALPLSRLSAKAGCVGGSSFAVVALLFFAGVASVHSTPKSESPGLRRSCSF
ncbi:MAG: hypothetical protein O3C40_34205 [Planctomycetota bacterium]|nr:hypothetical protein [Planctomycetota bacterium]